MHIVANQTHKSKKCNFFESGTELWCCPSSCWGDAL